MALADPQSVTIDETPVSLPRTGLALSEGKFSDATGQVTLTVMHGTARRTRHTIKLQKSAIVADPLVPSVNQNVTHSAHIVLDIPKNGVSIADAVELGDALVALCTSSFLSKVAAGES